jgi:hypothetical protein
MPSMDSTNNSEMYSTEMMEHPKLRQAVADLWDRMSALESSNAELRRLAEIMLKHEAENDTKLNDIVRVKQWWKNPPPPPPESPLGQRVKKLEEQLAALKKAMQ